MSFVRALCDFVTLTKSVTFVKQLFSEPLNRHSRVLKPQELDARFLEGLSNPSGVSVERFYGFLAVHTRAFALRGSPCRFYA